MTRWCISQIAWRPEEEQGAAELMLAHGLRAVELAPARVGDVAATRAFWESRGIRIVAMQALLFGRPELRVFGATRAQTLAELTRVIRLGAQLGAHALVFGSPKNRARGALPADEAFRSAVDFFGTLGAVAAAEGTCLCIEPNPPQYGADFITDSVEALRLVEAVASPGFGLHLDAACARLAGEDLPSRVRVSAHVLRHLHWSEPELAPVTPRPEVGETETALREVDYRGYVSIEMRSHEGDNLQRVDAALAITRVP